jgi:hypothetical protein
MNFAWSDLCEYASAFEDECCGQESEVGAHSMNGKCTCYLRSGCAEPQRQTTMSKVVFGVPFLWTGQVPL